MTDPYRITHSHIHGVGLMATRLIAKDEMVYAPRTIGWGGYNHSCEPTLGERVGEIGSPRPALRNILPGEELTISYTKFNGHTVFCNCSTCGGKGSPHKCNCPLHQDRSAFMSALILGTGLMLSGFLYQLEEIWVDKLQLPRFWKGKK